MIRQWQGKMYGRESEAWMYSPDYIKLAEAFGGVGFRVTKAEEIEDTMRQAMLVRDKPVIIDFVVAEKVDVYPWVPSGAGNEDMLTENKAP
jgi:acetolactate synthase-1/2/3 large subunit